MSEKVDLQTLKKILIKRKPTLSEIELTEDTKLLELQILDSFLVIQLALDLEIEFEISLDYMDMGFENFQTLGKLLALIRSKRACPSR